MRWIWIALVGFASAGWVVIGVATNWAFGSSLGRTPFECCLIGGALACADLLKSAAPIAMSRSSVSRTWIALVLIFVGWGTFTVSSGLSAVGVVASSRSLVVDSRKVQAQVIQSRLAGLQADQMELNRVRDRLASGSVPRSERSQLLDAAHRLETSITANREKVEISPPIVTAVNPQMHILANLSGRNVDDIETALTIMVALVVEIGAFVGPVMLLNLLKGSGRVNVPNVPATSSPTKALEPSPTSKKVRPQLIYSSVGASAHGDLQSFLKVQTVPRDSASLSSTELLTQFNQHRQHLGLVPVSQRAFGDAMAHLGHTLKVRQAGGRVHYAGLGWKNAVAAAA